ncbi:integrase [Leptospira weilii serovar Heyan]|nr:integrase [Leptospira weilii serovar Heyan]
MDIKFLNFKISGRKTIKRLQCEAIGDVTRVRILKIYDKHTQKNAIHFHQLCYCEIPFRIKQIRTDNGHEFQVGIYQEPVPKPEEK